MFTAAPAIRPISEVIRYNPAPAVVRNEWTAEGVPAPKAAPAKRVAFGKKAAR